MTTHIYPLHTLDPPMNNLMIILRFNIETPNFKPLTPDTHHSR